MIKVKEEIIRENPSYLLKALEYSSDGIYICDKEANTLYVNPAYEEISGLKKSDIIGENLKTLLEKNAFNISASLEVLKNKETVSLIHRYISGRTAFTTARPIYDDGEMIGVICNTRDVDELSSLKRELEQANIEKKRYSEELELLRKKNFSSEGIIYESKAMEETLNIAATAAKFDSTILISGESGTGKEVVAKFIYENSSREDGPFIKVNCAAIPKNLFESELFGYMPGSFTGASDEGKAGMFELANGGTILLDEIGELTMPIQSKLLRVIQEKEVYRVGGTEPIKLDVRIIAATNKDIPKEIKEGRFREDLYFRLNVVPVKIPPLRKREGDVAAMMNYFMTRLNSKYDRNITISKEAEEALIEYTWPGNVRELENVIEYMFIMNDAEEIGIGQLPDKILHEHILKDDSLDREKDKGNLQYLMEVYEKIVIESALKKHSSMRQTAKTLEISPSTLSRKIKKLNIEI